jgi:hypothetical protein
MTYEIVESPNESQFYVNVSALNPKAFYHTDLRGSLEKIIANEEQENKKDILGTVFTDKTKNLKSTIRALFQEIQLREKLDDHLLNRIDDDLCRQETELRNLKGLGVYYNFDKLMEIKKKKNQLETNVLELQQEKRKEYLECWRDLMFMKKYLLTALKDYWDISKRRDALAFDVKKLSENENNRRY